MPDSSYSKPDFWALKARQEGYPARSVYKLQEIDRKFGLLKPTFHVLDIGAAPGSWSMWILRRLGASGSLTAVDLQPLKPWTHAPQAKHTPTQSSDPETVESTAPPKSKPTLPDFHFIQGDIRDATVLEALRLRGPFHVVVSDAAPATSGNRFVDQSQSANLVECVIECACSVLRPGGSLVAKIFQGGGEREILDQLRSRFATAKAFKPESCRSESFETYLIATGFRDPGR